MVVQSSEKVVGVPIGTLWVSPSVLWFLRLDYYLWKDWHRNKWPQLSGFREHIERFAFRDNRSVEHVQPQNPVAPAPEWDRTALDGFGNLALISSTANSSYGNDEAAYKADKFLYRLNKYGLESLKQLWIYVEIVEHDDWTPTLSARHRGEMLRVLLGTPARPTAEHKSIAEKEPVIPLAIGSTKK